MSEDDLRNVPQNDLDFNMMTTNSVWGRKDISPEVNKALTRYFKSIDEEGKEEISESSLWGLLGFFTRDMRLGNLSKYDELPRCRYMIDLANDLLNIGMERPFLISLSRAANILETSQSKNGFLRNALNTLTMKNINRNEDPPKKGFMGKAKKGGEF